MREKENKQYTWLQGEGLAGRKPSSTCVAAERASQYVRSPDVGHRLCEA